MLTPDARKAYFVAALTPRSRVRLPSGQWSFLMAEVVDASDVAVDVGRLLAEHLPVPKVSATDFIQKVVHLEKHGCTANAACKQAALELKLSGKARKRLGLRQLRRAVGRGVALAG